MGDNPHKPLPSGNRVARRDGTDQGRDCIQGSPAFDNDIEGWIRALGQRPRCRARACAAFTLRELERHEISRPAAAFALALAGALSTGSLLMILATGALASGHAVAAAFGPLASAAVAAGMAEVVLGLRCPPVGGYSNEPPSAESGRRSG